MSSHVIDTPEGIERFRMSALKGMLKMEIAGMKTRRGTMTPLQAVNKALGTNYRSKKKAVEHLEREGF